MCGLERCNFEGSYKLVKLEKCELENRHLGQFPSEKNSERNALLNSHLVLVNSMVHKTATSDFS